MMDETLWEGLIPGDEIAPQPVVMVGDVTGAPVGQAMRSTRCKHETLFFKENRTIIACKCGLELPTAGVRMLEGGALIGMTVEAVARRLFDADPRIVCKIVEARLVDPAINFRTALDRAWSRSRNARNALCALECQCRLDAEGRAAILMSELTECVG